MMGLMRLAKQKREQEMDETARPLMDDSAVKKVEKPPGRVLSMQEELSDMQSSDRKQDAEPPGDGESSFALSYMNHKQEVDKLLEELDIHEKASANQSGRAGPIDASKIIGFVGDLDSMNRTRLPPILPNRKSPKLTEQESIDLLEELDLKDMLADDATPKHKDLNHTQVPSSDLPASRQSWRYPIYYTDDDAPIQRRGKSESEEVSIISSDTSFKQELERLRLEEQARRKQAEEEKLYKGRAAQRSAYRRNRIRRKEKSSMPNLLSDAESQTTQRGKSVEPPRKKRSGVVTNLTAKMTQWALMAPIKAAEKA